MTPNMMRMLLTTAAIRFRAEADELRMGARLAEINAENCETLVCSGTDDEVLKTLNVIAEVDRALVPEIVP